MSVQSEITRLENAKAAIKTAIEGKGVTVPDAALLDSMATLIESINTGVDENGDYTGNTIPIDKGGTGATTAEDAIANLGINDFIVAQGSDSNWIYWAKFKNGLAICISDKKQNGNFPSEAWGSLYRGLSIAGIAFPFAFSSVPCSFFTRVSADTTSYHEISTWCAPWGGSSTTSPSVILLRPTNTTIGHPYIRIVTIGKWT